MTSRQRLPNRRLQFTGTMLYEGLEYEVSVGVREETGELAEIFIAGQKDGSHMQRLGNDSAVLASVAIQCGASVERLAASMGRLPEGPRSSVIGAALDFAAELVAGLRPWVPPPMRLQTHGRRY